MEGGSHFQKQDLFVIPIKIFCIVDKLCVICDDLGKCYIKPFSLIWIQTSQQLQWITRQSPTFIKDLTCFFEKLYKHQ